VFGGGRKAEDGENISDDVEQPVALSVEPEKPLLGLKRHALDDFDSELNRRLKIDGTLWAAYNAAVWAVDYKRLQHATASMICASLKAPSLRRRRNVRRTECSKQPRVDTT
jgi:hypothetical protein